MKYDSYTLYDPRLLITNSYSDLADNLTLNEALNVDKLIVSWR